MSEEIYYCWRYSGEYLLVLVIPHIDLYDFPKLRVDPSNVFSSGSTFIEQFETDSRFKVKAAGTKICKVDSDEVEVEAY